MNGGRSYSTAACVALILAVCSFGGCGSPGTQTAGRAPSATVAARPGAFAGELDLVGLANFERANVKLLNVTNATGPRDAAQSQLRAACLRLDADVPMLRAFARRCGYTLGFTNAMHLRSERCDGNGGVDRCEHAYRLIAKALDGLATGTRAFKRAAKAATDDEDCLDALLPSARSTAAMVSSARSARRAASALHALDEPAFRRSDRAFMGSLFSTLDDRGPAQPIIDRIRSECGLEKTQSPPGERES